MRKPDAKPRLVLAGDVAVETAEPDVQMGKIAPYLRASSIAFCNCEWPLTDRGTPFPGKAGRVVRSAPGLVRTYTISGFDVVSLANNHVMNFGPEGMVQTIEILDKAGIAHCGGGADLESAHRPAIVERNGKRYAFLSYTSVFTPGFEAGIDRPGMAVVKIDANYRIPKRLHEVPGMPFDTDTRPNQQHADRVADDIRRAKSQSDAVIVSWHWGVSMLYQHLIPYQKTLGRLAVDAGANLVVGHHPHTIQGIELYKGKPIAYSLGHCGFDMESSSSTEDSILLEVALTRNGLGEASVVPLANAVVQPKIAEGDEARLTLDWVERLSRPLGTLIEGRQARAKVVEGPKPKAKRGHND
jgi:poly-gamma-glutamate synthesis protein (capsule biosynthesis protein)